MSSNKIIKFNLRFISKLAAVLCATSILVMVPRLAQAAKMCTGTLTGSFLEDIVVNNSSCTLNGVTTTGSVLVQNWGLLTVTGNTMISGDIQATNANSINLDSVTVNGGVSLVSSQNLRVGAGVALTSLSVVNSGSVLLDGSVGGTLYLLNSKDLTLSIGSSANSVFLDSSENLTARGSIGVLTTVNSRAVTLTGANITAGVNVTGGKANVTICGGTNIYGGVNLLESNASLLVGTTPGCGVSTINGSIVVGKGTGDVKFTNTLLEASDLVVTSQIGNIVGKGAAFSDITAESITGSVSLTGISTDSDTTIVNITGGVTIASSTMGSDVAIITNGPVNLTGNDFDLEDVLIGGGTGAVVLSNNTRMGLAITERNNVTVSGNTFTIASISKNTGVISIVNNRGLEVGALLSCSDNLPAPTGYGNTNLVKTEQCAGL